MFLCEFRVPAQSCKSKSFCCYYITRHRARPANRHQQDASANAGYQQDAKMSLVRLHLVIKENADQLASLAGQPEAWLSFSTDSCPPWAKNFGSLSQFTGYSGYQAHHIAFSMQAV
jgi:hypothetical protein